MANTMNLHRVVVDAIWTNLEESPIDSDRDGDNAYVGEGETIDSSRIDMRQMADGVLMALDEANTIRTVEALHALPLQLRADEHGVLIQDRDNDIFERNFDGTWCIIDRPDAGRSWCDRDVPSSDIGLPVVVLRGL